MAQHPTVSQRRRHWPTDRPEPAQCAPDVRGHEYALVAVWYRRRTFMNLMRSAGPSRRLRPRAGAISVLPDLFDARDGTHETHSLARGVATGRRPMWTRTIISAPSRRAAQLSRAERRREYRRQRGRGAAAGARAA